MLAWGEGWDGHADDGVVCPWMTEPRRHASCVRACVCACVRACQNR